MDNSERKSVKRMNIHQIMESYKDKKVIIFGTGNMAKIIANSAKNISFFIDNDKSKWKTLFLNRQVYSPTKLKEIEKDKIIIIIASMYYDQIAVQLKDMGLEFDEHFIDGRLIYESTIAKKNQRVSLEYKGDRCSIYDENIQNNKSCILKEEYNKLNSFLNSQYKQVNNKSENYIEYEENFRLDLNGDDPKIITFYLPQFHAIPENDKWWGRGFTEWTNVTRALPLFEGHHQPQLPIDLGFYDLKDINIMRRQAELAKQYGVYGFCFYYYWFNKKRLLELPVENFFDNKDIDFKYSLCWANENWTKRWDGQENDILISQNYSMEDDIDFIASLEKFFRDERYIRIDNKPILLVYRPQLLPDPEQTINRWRNYCRECGIGEIYLISCKAFGLKDPTDFGFDAGVEFPPNNIYNPKLVNDKLTIFNKQYKGRIIDLKSWILFDKHLEIPECKTFKTAFSAWDNTARRPNDSTIFYDATPQLYKSWLKDNILYTKKNMNKSEQLVFVNAWNEWAEGAHLEPDRLNGYANLMATSEAIIETRNYTKRKLVFIIEEEEVSQYKELNKNILKYLSKMFNYIIEIIYITKTNDKKNNPLCKYGNVYTVDKEAIFSEELKKYLKTLYNKGFKKFICNVHESFMINKILSHKEIQVTFLLSKHIEKNPLCDRTLLIPNGMIKENSNFNAIQSRFKDFLYDLLFSVGEQYKKLSVIMPNYNYGNYIRGRLSSIINQSYPIYELIILDDCSEDNSVYNIKCVMENVESLKYRLIDYKIIVNDKNSGSVFKQWIKGIHVSKGEYIWIAEADDLCNRNFLEKTIGLYDIDKDIVFAYSQSKQIDENDEILSNDYLSYTDDIDTLKWRKSYICSGIDEIKNALVIKNTIPNVSAAIIKKNNISSIIDELQHFRFGGDLFFYVWLLQKGKIGFCSESLNYHRRHTKSVTSGLGDLDRNLVHYQEIVWLQNYIIEKFNVDDCTKEKAYKYREKVKCLLNIQ